MLSRLNRLNASQISCTRVRAGRDVARDARIEASPCEGSRNWLRVVPGAMSLRVLPSLFEIDGADARRVGLAGLRGEDRR